MREAVMSTGLLEVADVAWTPERELESPDIRTIRPAQAWSPERFAHEQIRGLVRQVFSSSAPRRVRQVVFSAVEPQSDVGSICMRVGESLAMETLGSIAVVWRHFQGVAEAEMYAPESTRRADKGRSASLRETATQVRSNLWLLPARSIGGESVSRASLHDYLGEIRREFDYSIVEAPPAGESNEATVMAQFADGIILVLSAQRTRWVTASKIKQSLEDAQARLLGTVLNDREFPIPERIYRRL